jgi:hypothetical protein
MFDEEQYDEGYMPLDEAVAHMVHGYDMNAYEGHSPLFDPYFED